MFDIEGFVFRQFDSPKPYGSPATDWKVDCPFCEDRVGKIDEEHKLHISIHKQVVHCFRCDYSKTWWQFVGDILGTTNHIDIFSELYEVPAVRDFQSLESGLFAKATSTYPVTAFSLPEDFESLSSTNSSLLLRMARKYAKERGFGRSYWIKYGLGVAMSVGWRLVIPIEADYWQARALRKQNPKYLNPGKANRHALFNHNAINLYNEVVVCEGAFSAMSVGSNAIAMLRKKATLEQASRLITAPVKRYILTVEPNAFLAMDFLADTLRRHGKEVVLWCYKDGDPNDTEEPNKIVDYTLKSRVEMLLNAK